MSTSEPQSNQILAPDGLRLRYLDWGNPGAQPMVLLHGLQDCARSWDFFAHNMRSEYRVLALDHRGHGDSDWARPPTTGYRLQDYVSDVEALVEQLGLDNIALVGHSAGGRNAFAYATRHPERVASLAIVDIDPDAVNPESTGMFSRYLSESDEWKSLEAVIERLRSRQPNSSDEMLEHQALHMTRSVLDEPHRLSSGRSESRDELPSGGRVWKRDRKLLEAYERPDLWREWRQITHPTLILRGRQSNLLTHEVAVKMREAISRVRLVELDGGGHWFYQEFPGAFEAAVRWFLESPPQ